MQTVSTTQHSSLTGAVTVPIPFHRRSSVNTIKVLVLSLSFTLCTCTIYRPHLPGYFYDDGFYKNSNAGFKVHLPDDWEIGSTLKTVPKSFGKQLKDFQSESAEMLFMGLSPNGRCGVRCITEANDTTLEAFFKQAFFTNESDVIKLRADYYRGHGQELILWNYLTESGGSKYKFQEYVFSTGRLKHRIAFWTLAGLFDDYKKTFDDAAKTIYCSDTSADTSKIWNDTPLWTAKERSDTTFTFDFATDKKELFFSKDSTVRPCDKSFLWKVSGRSAQCYIFGSIHVLKPEMYPLKKQVETAFDSSSSLVLEIDISLPETTKKMTDMAKSGFYSGNATIKNDIPAPLYDKVIAWASSKGLPKDKLTKLKPWMAALVMQQILMASLGLSPEYGVEKYFINKKQKKEILELETVDDQAALFESIRGEDLLAYTLFDIDKTEEKMQTLIDAWSCGDSTAMSDITFSEIPAGSDELLDKMYYRRNIQMAKKIEQYVKDGKKCFVVVGAAHLVGAKSVIELLQQSGLKVEQL